MAKEVNIFLDNRPGRLRSVAEVLSQNSINIRTMTLQDRTEFGLMKLIVDEPEKAHAALLDKGFACALKEILAIIVNDKPGSFLKLADVFTKHGINILDAYGFVIESNKNAVFCVEVKDPQGMRNILAQEGFQVLDGDQLYQF
ncbi:MAG TPA: ACT domain-containing protein [Candidatus Omnitrophota bacterium]|nr:ACT domain-containing protein [Candidatus Omnitrophota bacterium]HPT07313.1 ACT domain-containing protein [Candidatus Omnitrophota bacterium]